MRKFTRIVLLAFILPFSAFSQDTLIPIKVPGLVLEGDTLPFVDLNSVVVFPPVTFHSKRELLKYDKFVYNVRTVYPYAKLAGEKFMEFKAAFDTIKSEKKKKEFIRQAQKELEDEFGDRIRDMTFSQGKILIKLIYRQTGNSSFEVIRELRGGFTAFIWQTMARIFGYDLKTGYDPAGEDQAIERIVLMIESGAL